MFARDISHFVCVHFVLLHLRGTRTSIELWDDVYGNSILQKLIEFGTDDIKTIIGKRLLSDTVFLSTRVLGWWVRICQPQKLLFATTLKIYYIFLIVTSRVIHKAFDNLNNIDVANLISTFNGNVLRCLHDDNGERILHLLAQLHTIRLLTSLRTYRKATMSFRNQSRSCQAWQKKLEIMAKMICVPSFSVASTLLLTRL